MSSFKVIKTIPCENIFLSEENIQCGNISSETEDGIINVYEDITYQEVIGFGGAFTESAAYNYSLMSPDTKKEFMEKYFSCDKGIGYNFGRCHINSCDFSLDIYSYVENGDDTLTTFNIERDKKYIIPFIKDAMSYCKDELILFASPWSPPAYMKENEAMIKGGKIKDKYKSLWASYYAKFIKAYKNEGIKITAISVQNEPKAIQTWESCFYSPEDERDFIANYLTNALDKEGLSDIKIIIWDHNKERVFDRAKTIFEDKKVLKRVWAIGHHWYSGDHYDALRLVHEVFDKTLICTEFCDSIKSDVNSVAERYAKEICENFNNFDNASCDWNILLDTNGGPFHNRTNSTQAVPGMVLEDKEGGCYAPVLYDTQKDKAIFTPIYYYIGHFSKFVKRGAVRIATTKYTDKLNVCAFKNPDNSLTAIVVNTSDDNLPAIIRINNECTEINMKSHSVITAILNL